MNAILIDTLDFKVVREVQCDFSKKVEGMYYRIEGHLMPAAYVYPIEKREEVVQLLVTLRDAKNAYDDLAARIFYKDLPRLKAGLP